MGIPGNNLTHINPRRLESAGIVELLHPEILITEMLAPEIVSKLSKTSRPKFDTNGTVNAAQILDSLLKGQLVGEPAG
jgi:predicted glycosyltransferase